jgi:tetratricopeptide (TPR) repeat protein
MYFFTTERFDQKAAKYSLLDEVETRKETIRQGHIPAKFNSMPPYFKYRKGKLRIIAKCQRINEYDIFCVLDVFERKDSQYESLYRNPRVIGKSLIDALIDDEALSRWLEEQLANADGAPLSLPEPIPDELHLWLDSPGWEMSAEDQELTVYESEVWTNCFRQQAIRNYWQTYSDLVAKATTGKGQKVDKWLGVLLVEGGRHHVLYSLVDVQDTESQQLSRVLFLIAPFDHCPLSDEIADALDRANLRDLLQTPNFGQVPVVLDTLTSYARRAYPYYILADGDSWLAIESESELNLALSSEEARLLQGISSPSSDTTTLPLFINGKAGSGKSTMLLYLFADYCFRKIKHNLDGEPLFLTYNEALLRVARDGVSRLLSYHHRFIENRSENSTDAAVFSYFRPFRNFLLALLPAEEREGFEPSRYISFHRFSRWYNGQMPASSNQPEEDRLERDIVLSFKGSKKPTASAELCWHVIRTFIKGSLLDGWMEPEDYEEIPRKERTISEATFREVHDMVWGRWYGTIVREKGFWDDQDLIRRVLELQSYEHKYTAIFCDEAQDFTRLELQLVMRLSIFSQYSLAYQGVKNLPFAFARDPGQTLNPTGFRWSSTQAVFYDTIVATLDPMRQSIRPSFRELLYNYRSTPQIVRFTNLIQMWRGILFGLNELQPQQCWQRGNFPDVRKYLIEQSTPLDTLKSLVENTIIIIPCEEGQEVEYIQKDSTLSQIFPADAKPVKNVLSTVSAKGLEFRRVILYKFGEACDIRSWDLLNQSVEAHEDHPIEFEYFFNKLYVAASRAMHYLFIIDSAQGNEQLWRYAEPGQLATLLANTRNPAVWHSHIQGVLPGVWAEAREMQGNDPHAVAEELKNKGLQAQNADLLRRASQYFNTAGDQYQADICVAWALCYERQFREAGIRFKSLGKREEAWHCFWEGMFWPDLFVLIESMPEARADQVALVRFVSATPDDTDSILAITQTLHEKTQEVSTLFSRQWLATIKIYQQRIMNIPYSALRLQQWGVVAQTLEMLARTGHPDILRCAGLCYFNATHYDRALHCWDRTGGDATQHQDYYLAKYQVVGLPEGLEWARRLSDGKERILRDFINAGGIGQINDQRWLKEVGPILEERKSYDEAMRIYMQLKNTDQVRRCFDNRFKDGAANIETLSQLCEYLIDQDQWSSMIESLERYLPTTAAGDQDKSHLRLNLLRKLAHTHLATDKIKNDERPYFERIIEQISTTPGWEQHRTLQEMGALYEKVGIHVNTLRFYERFTSLEKATEDRDFARLRWIATKRKQEEYFKSQDQQDRANLTRGELRRRMRKWKLSDTIEVPSQLVLTQTSQHTDIIQGLPHDIQVQQFPNGQIHFKIDHLDIRVLTQARRLSIQDSRSLDTQVIDLNKCTISGRDDAILENETGEVQAYAVQASDYTVTLDCTDERRRVELKPHSLSEPITVRL